jgi:hypothetical protein
MIMSDENIDLREFDEDFEGAEVEKREFEAVPDGKYQVKVEAVELVRSKTANNPMLKWKLRILAPSHQGRFLWRNNVIGSAENLKWLKTDLATCGLHLKKLSDLPAHLRDLLDVNLEVTKKTKGTNENIYFNRLLVLAEGTQKQGWSSLANSPDIPF